MPSLRSSLLAAGFVRTFQVSLPSASFYCELSDTNSMNTQFQFRLNGVIITHMKVRPALIDAITARWELVALPRNARRVRGR